jgi:plasmid stabilization system protein ParE
VKIRILHQAEADVIRHFRYFLVEYDSQEVALRFKSSFRETLKLIERNPRIGKPCVVPAGALRSWPVSGFDALKIYYRLVSSNIEVIRILHSKQDVHRILRKLELG